MMEYFPRIVYDFFAKGSILDENRWLFSLNAPSLLVDTILNTPLKYENIQGEKSTNFLEIFNQ